MNEPTTDYEQALARLRRNNHRITTIGGGEDFVDLIVSVDGDTVYFECDGQYIWLSAAMLRRAAEWVASDRTPNPVLMTGPGTGAA